MLNKELCIDSFEKGLDARPGTGLQTGSVSAAPLFCEGLFKNYTPFICWWYTPLITTVICFSAPFVYVSSCAFCFGNLKELVYYQIMLFFSIILIFYNNHACKAFYV